MRTNLATALGLPGWRWLLVALTIVVAAGVATPLLAQTVAVTRWSIGGGVSTIDVDASDQVWANVGGLPKKLDPATNELTAYSYPGGGGGAMDVDGSGKAWLPGSLATLPTTTNVLTRLDPATLQVTSWPSGNTGSLETSITVDSAGNPWAGASTNYLKRLNPATNTVTTWTLPVSVNVWNTDSLGRVWLTWWNGANSGPAVFDPGTNTLTYWVAAASPDSAANQVFVDAGNKIWFAIVHSVGEDGIARLDPVTNQITQWICPPGCDRLYAVSVDSSGKVWFTEDGQAAGFDYTGTSYIGRLDAAADPPVWNRWDVHCDNVNGSYCGMRYDSGCRPLDRTNPRSAHLDSTSKVWVYFAGHGAYTAQNYNCPPISDVWDDIARLTPP